MENTKLTSAEAVELDARVEALRGWARDNLSFEQAIYMFALHKAVADGLSSLLDQANGGHLQTVGVLRDANSQAIAAAAALRGAGETLRLVPQHLKNAVLVGVRAEKIKASRRAKSAADALHDKPGGSRDKKTAILQAWTSGKYTSRDVCAEQECAGLNMSFSAARKALRNTPKPI